MMVLPPEPAELPRRCWMAHWRVARLGWHLEESLDARD